jgi:hypothetical protein
MAQRSRHAKTVLTGVTDIKNLPSGTAEYRLPRRRGRELTPREGRAKMICKCLGRKRAVYAPNSIAVTGGITCFCGALFRVGAR